MGRRMLGAVALAAGLGTAAAVIPATPAPAATLIQVCITLQPRNISVTLNGTPILGVPVAGTPRTCVGI